MATRVRLTARDGVVKSGDLLECLVLITSVKRKGARGKLKEDTPKRPDIRFLAGPLVVEQLW